MVEFYNSLTENDDEKNELASMNNGSVSYKVENNNHNTKFKIRVYLFYTIRVHHISPYLFIDLIYIYIDLFYIIGSS